METALPPPVPVKPFWEEPPPPKPPSKSHIIFIWIAFVILFVVLLGIMALLLKPGSVSLAPGASPDPTSAIFNQPSSPPSPSPVAGLRLVNPAGRILFRFDRGEYPSVFRYENKLVWLEKNDSGLTPYAQELTDQTNIAYPALNLPGFKVEFSAVVGNFLYVSTSNEAVTRTDRFNLESKSWEKINDESSFVVEWELNRWLVADKRVGDCVTSSLNHLDSQKIKFIATINNSCPEGNSLVGLDNQTHLLIASYKVNTQSPKPEYLSISRISVSQPSSIQQLISSNDMPTGITEVRFDKANRRIQLLGSVKFLYFLDTGELRLVSNLSSVKPANLQRPVTQTPYSLVRNLELPQGYQLLEGL